MGLAGRACPRLTMPVFVFVCGIRMCPSKHETLNQCLFNVGPASQTLVQHWINIGTFSRICQIHPVLILNWENTSSIGSMPDHNLTRWPTTGPTFIILTFLLGNLEMFSRGWVGCQLAHFTTSNTCLIRQNLTIEWPLVDYCDRWLTSAGPPDGTPLIVGGGGGSFLVHFHPFTAHFFSSNFHPITASNNWNVFRSLKLEATFLFYNNIRHITIQE